MTAHFVELPAPRRWFVVLSDTLIDKKREQLRGDITLMPVTPEHARAVVSTLLSSLSPTDRAGVVKEQLEGMDATQLAEALSAHMPSNCSFHLSRSACILDIDVVHAELAASRAEVERLRHDGEWRRIELDRLRNGMFETFDLEVLDTEPDEASDLEDVRIVDRAFAFFDELVKARKSLAAEKQAHERTLAELADAQRRNYYERARSAEADRDSLRARVGELERELAGVRAIANKCADDWNKEHAARSKSEAELATVREDRALVCRQLDDANALIARGVQFVEGDISELANARAAVREQTLAEVLSIIDADMADCFGEAVTANKRVHNKIAALAETQPTPEQKADGTGEHKPGAREGYADWREIDRLRSKCSRQRRANRELNRAYCLLRGREANHKENARRWYAQWQLAEQQVLFARQDREAAESKLENIQCAIGKAYHPTAYPLPRTAVTCVEELIEQRDSIQSQLAKWEAVMDDLLKFAERMVESHAAPGCETGYDVSRDFARRIRSAMRKGEANG